MKRKTMFLVLAAVCTGSYARSQDTTNNRQLEEVIITATKFPQKQSSTGKVVAVIDRETLQRNAGKTIPEILNTQAGIFINGANNNLGTNQDVYMRGAASGNTLVLIDGIPVGDPSQINNGFDINSIATAQVERIEILRGAQSTLWGSDAVAGVINIITKKGSKNPFTTSASLAYGTYNTLRGSAGIQGSLDRFDYHLNYNYTNSRGFSSAYDSTGNKNFDKDDFLQNNIQANLGYKINSRFSLKAMYSRAHYRSAIDAGAFKDDDDYEVKNNNEIKHLGLAYQASKIKIQISQTLVNAKRMYIDDSTDIGGFSNYSEGHYRGHSAVTEAFANYTPLRHLALVSGVQYLCQNTRQDYWSISAYGRSASALGDSAKANNLSFYNSFLVTDVKNANMEIGFRYNRHSLYGSNSTYTFNPSYNIDTHTRLFVNVASAFKTPSLYQLYSEYGNKSLQPEKSINYELGVHVSTSDKRSGYRIIAFRRNSKNLIVFYTTADGISQYSNRDEQQDYGFELESNIALGKWGTLNSNLTYVDGEGKNNGIKVRNLYRRPNFVLNSILTLQPTSRLCLSPGFRFVGTRLKGQYDAGPALQPQYYTLDLYAAYSFQQNIRVFADFRNITNQQYFDIAGYNSRRFNMMAGIGYHF